MRTQFRGYVFSALAGVLVAALVSGCGSGGELQSRKAGVTGSATVTGNVVSISAQTDRTDIAQAWATVTGVAAPVMLTGSGRHWTGSTQVNAAPDSILTIEVFARDSVGTVLGPAKIQARMGQFGTQPTVTGLVVSGADGTPILGARVTLGNQSTATDSAGRFVISTGLVPGITLSGVVNKSGFAEARFTVTVTQDTVNIGQVALNATQDLPPPAPVFP